MTNETQSTAAPATPAPAISAGIKATETKGQKVSKWLDIATLILQTLAGIFSRKN
jgi:hypothetical protein